MAIQIGRKYILYFLPRGGGILLRKYRDRKGMCIAILFESIGSGVELVLLKKRYDAVLPPFISIVRSPGRPVILDPQCCCVTPIPPFLLGREGGGPGHVTH